MVVPATTAATTTTATTTATKANDDCGFKEENKPPADEEEEENVSSKILTVDRSKFFRLTSIDERQQLVGGGEICRHHRPDQRLLIRITDAGNCSKFPWFGNRTNDTNNKNSADDDASRPRETEVVEPPETDDNGGDRHSTFAVAKAVLYACLAVVLGIPVICGAVVAGSVVGLTLLTSYLACEAVWFVPKRRLLLREYAHRGIVVRAEVVQTWETLRRPNTRAARRSERSSSSPVLHVRLRYRYDPARIPGDKTTKSAAAADEESPLCPISGLRPLTVFKTLEPAVKYRSLFVRDYSGGDETARGGSGGGAGNNVTIPLLVLPGHPMSGIPLFLLKDRGALNGGGDGRPTVLPSKSKSSSSNDDGIIDDIDTTRDDRYFMMLFAILMGAVEFLLVRGLAIAILHHRIAAAEEEQARSAGDDVLAAVTESAKRNVSDLVFVGLLVWNLFTMAIIKILWEDWVVSEPYLCRRVDTPAPFIVRAVVTLTPDHRRWSWPRSAPQGLCLCCCGRETGSDNNWPSRTIAEVLRDLVRTGELARVERLRDAIISGMMPWGDDGSPLPSRKNDRDDRIYYASAMDLVESVWTRKEQRRLRSQAGDGSGSGSHSAKEEQELEDLLDAIETKCLQRLEQLEGRTVILTRPGGGGGNRRGNGDNNSSFTIPSSSPSIRDVGRRLHNDRLIPPSLLVRGTSNMPATTTMTVSPYYQYYSDDKNANKDRKGNSSDRHSAESD